MSYWKPNIAILRSSQNLTFSNKISISTSGPAGEVPKCMHGCAEVSQSAFQIVVPKAWHGPDPVPRNPGSAVLVPRTPGSADSWFRGLLVPRFCCNRQGRPQLMRTGTRANQESYEPGFMRTGSHGNRDSDELGLWRTGILANRGSTVACSTQAEKTLRYCWLVLLLADDIFQRRYIRYS